MTIQYCRSSRKFTRPIDPDADLQCVELFYATFKKRHNPKDQVTLEKLMSALFAEVEAQHNTMFRTNE